MRIGNGLLAVVILLVAVFSFVSVAHSQDVEWTVFVDGSPLPLPRPVTPKGGDLYVPLAPLTRVLGFQTEFVPEFKGLRLRRGAGAPIEYDGRTGEIRFGPVIAGQLQNYQQTPVSPPLEELLFPVDGLITLLAVDVQLDHGARTINIRSARDPFNLPSARGVGVSSLDYSFGIARASGTGGHYTLLRSAAMGAGLPFTSSFLLTGEGIDTRLQQGTVVADLGLRRVITAGDQTTLSGVEALTSSVRGLGFNAPLKSFEASVYAGRAAGSVRARHAGPGVAGYDSTIVGAALRRKDVERDLSFAANGFTGAERKGASLGASFAKTTDRNQLKAQVVGGGFSGLSLRTTTVREDYMPVLPGGSAAIPEVKERTEVQGGALGLSFFDSYRPIDGLAVTVRLARYGKNFLAAREDSELNGQSLQSLSVAFRPWPTFSLYGDVNRRRFLAGDPGLLRSYSYGATAMIPAVRWLQVGHFRVVQSDSTSMMWGRLQLNQYSATLMNIREYTGSVTFSDMQFSNTRTRTSHLLLSRSFSSAGRLTVNDQFQSKTVHRYGAEWQTFIRGGNLRFGLDRSVSLRTTDRYLVPRFGLTFTLPGKQRLTATYFGERGTHMLNIVLSGPLISRDEFRRDVDGQMRIVAQASLEGRIYFDSNDDNAFNPKIDRPMSGITVRLDGQPPVVTDDAGLFRFDTVKSGTHVVRADLSEVPADMVFADSAERRIAVLPFRENVQDFPVVRTGAVTGKVTYLDFTQDPEQPTGRPMPEARIIADGEHDTYSDLSGNITLGSLRPGVYELKVDPETAPAGYIASVEPREIRVRPGETLRGVQILLKPAPREVVVQELPRQESITAP